MCRSVAIFIRMWFWQVVALIASSLSGACALLPLACRVYRMATSHIVKSRSEMSSQTNNQSRKELDVIPKDEANSYATVKTIGQLGFVGALLTENVARYRSIRTRELPVRWNKGVIENIILASITFNAVAIFLALLLSRLSPSEDKKPTYGDGWLRSGGIPISWYPKGVLLFAWPPLKCATEVGGSNFTQSCCWQ
jgi:hypothetical protein